MILSFISSKSRLAFTGLSLLAAFALLAPSVYAENGDTLRLNTFNGWKAFEAITAGNNPSGGVNYTLPSGSAKFDGIGAWKPDDDTMRVLVNHELTDGGITEVEFDVSELQDAILSVIAGSNNTVGGATYVTGAQRAYDRWSDDGGSSWTGVNVASNIGSGTSFNRFCSGQSYAANTFGLNRGFVDPIYITGEEVDDGRLFALNLNNRDMYQLSGQVSASGHGGNGGMPFDSFENAALLDTGEEDHIALLLSPDGDSGKLQLYIGEKNPAGNFLERNGLAEGNYYYLTGSLGTSSGGFSTDSGDATYYAKLEDIDARADTGTQVVLGEQNTGVWIFDFDAGAGKTLDFSSGHFNAGASGFTSVLREGASGGGGNLDDPDNVDWTAATTLKANYGTGAETDYPDGLIFVNEDNSSGEIYILTPAGSSETRIASTTVGSESSGIFDISSMVDYMPGSILLTSNQGNPSSMSVLINPSATLAVPVEPSTLLGDMNGDFNVTLLDAPLFIEALVNRTAYDAHMFPINPDINGDVNGDGTFDLGDIGLFSGLFSGPASASADAEAVPEPTTLSLAAVLLMGIAIRPRRRA
jgi:hypothetical protein